MCACLFWYVRAYEREWMLHVVYGSAGLFVSCVSIAPARSAHTAGGTHKTKSYLTVCVCARWSNVCKYSGDEFVDGSGMKLAVDATFEFIPREWVLVYLAENRLNPEVLMNPAIFKHPEIFWKKSSCWLEKSALDEICTWKLIFLKKEKLKHRLVVIIFGWFYSIVLNEWNSKCIESEKKNCWLEDG